MLKVIEAFSGIGSQAKALKSKNIEHKIVATVDWDINAIIAYDLIHNGPQDFSYVEGMGKEDLRKELCKHSISPDGKQPYSQEGLNRLSESMMKRIVAAIKRCNNLVSITDIKGCELDDDIDLFTYSFPCQDLSIAGVWHGNQSGIDREAKNRSGMLWEVERILKERVDGKKTLPKFLLMENVSNILAPRHRGNFQEWTTYLDEIGYVNHYWCLNARDFGMPQNRKRVFMLSVFVGGDEAKRFNVNQYFEKHDLLEEDYRSSIVSKKFTVEELLRVDYENQKYRKEADENQQNNTPSRIKIFNENEHIYDGKVLVPVIKTITTKQDRNPNSGVIVYDDKGGEKAPYRTLTPRECFLFMGFEEKDFDILMENNFNVTKSRNFFSQSKLIKMAGNSIVVNVLEAIFQQVVEIKEILDE